MNFKKEINEITGDVFQGLYINDKLRYGQHFKDGVLQYEGEFGKAGKYHGYGKRYKNIRSEGMFKNGHCDCADVFRSRKLLFSGLIKDKKPFYGTNHIEQFQTHIKRSDPFVRKVPFELTYSVHFEGVFRDNGNIAYGTEYLTNGDIYYRGQFDNGRINGYGEFYDKNGRLTFVGRTKYSKKRAGKVYNPQTGKLRFEGLLNEKGKFLYGTQFLNGKAARHGAFRNGEFYSPDYVQLLIH